MASLARSTSSGGGLGGGGGGGGGTVGLFEFLEAAELQHYYSAIKNVLQVFKLPTFSLKIFYFQSPIYFIFAGPQRPPAQVRDGGRPLQHRDVEAGGQEAKELLQQGKESSTFCKKKIIWGNIFKSESA